MADDFPNDKKTFLAKLDKSQKREIDSRVVSIINQINSKSDYYTTSSCSGRVYLWQGGSKKNELDKLKVSHELINESFFQTFESGLIWLRLEDFILHVCCKDFPAANKLLEAARKLYKKSCLLSVSHKIIVEIKGSEALEMPFYLDYKPLFCGDYVWLKQQINSRLQKIWAVEKKFESSIKSL